MQRKITKNYQVRTLTRSRCLAKLLKLDSAHVALFDACAKKSPQEVRSILEETPNINIDLLRDHNMQTPLHVACGRSDDHAIATTIADMLIEAGADVNNGVGDKDGYQPMHMAVLAGNYQCVLLLLRQGASVPSSSAFRLTPLLLAKLKMDNMSGRLDFSQSAKNEYNDLTSITQVLVTHLANKHINATASNSRHGLSDCLFAKTDDLDETISSIADQLDSIQVGDDASLQGLLAKVKRLGINEIKKSSS